MRGMFNGSGEGLGRSNYAENLRIFNHLFFDTSRPRLYHCAPMSIARVPRHADLRKLAATGVTVVGEIPLAELKRLVAELVSSAGNVSVELHFGIDDAGLRVIGGSVGARLICICQRCLGEMDLAVQAEVNLVMTWDEAQLVALPAGVDGLVVGDEAADLYDIVEDELLLGLPFSPRHEDGECHLAVAAVANEVEERGDAERTNPFAEALQFYKLDPS